MPSKKEFLKLFDLFPKGNPEKTYTEIKYSIATRKTFREEPLTWEMIVEKYTEYIKKRKKENTQEVYIKSLMNFVEQGDYNIDFSKEPSKESKTMFESQLDDSIKELENRFKENGNKTEDNK